MLTHSFLIQRKAQDVYFEMEKFFTPTKSFLPPFLLMHCHHKHENFDLIIRYSPYSRGGKKLLGGKNFSLFDRVDFQVLPEEKSSESLENSLLCVEKKLGSKFHFFGIKMDAIL